MGDYTDARLMLRGAPAHIRTAVRTDFVERCGTLHDDEQDDTDGSLSIGGSDFRCGGAEEVRTFLDGLIAEGEEFAYQVWEDPKYEWLGDLHIHVPGVGSFRADCSADGTPILQSHQIKDMVDKAETLEALKETLLLMSGVTHEDAFAAYAAPEEASATPD